jgi:hypothetical protein
MATAKVPFELYVLDTSSKFSTPTPLSNLISTNTTGPLNIPNGLSIGTDNRLLVTPSGFELVSLDTIVDAVGGTGDNTVVLTYKDAAGATQTLKTAAVNSNVLAIVKGPTHPDNGGTNPSDLILRSTVNGVVSNDLGISQLVADINVDTFTWDPVSFQLVLTETSPDGGTTPGQTVTLDLGSLMQYVAGSLVGDGTIADPFTLDGDEVSPGNHKFYGTDEAGAKAFQNLVSTLPGNVITIDPTDETGGVYVGPSVGEAVEVIPGNAVDIPLDYIGDPTVNLYAPAEFRIALDQATGEPLVGPNGGNLMVALWEEAFVGEFPATAYESGAPAGLVVGTPYTSAAPAVPGTPALVYAVVGTIAPGLSIAPATGVISGTPTTAGPYAFTVSATNSAGSDTFAVSFVVAA